MPKLEIPRKTVYRLSIYQRCLNRLKDNQIETVSSEALAKAAGVKPTQLRKDLTYFGQFGTRGLGYNVAGLSGAIGDVLGSSKLQPVILVGVGNLGAALLRYGGFQKEGFEIVAAFDTKPDDRRVKGVKTPLLDAARLPSFIRDHQIKMAILTVPANHAQEVVNLMVESGIQAILNFSPVVLEVPKHLVVNNVDLAVELENLSYFIR
jgi:redox-sensing transcriptional repressor